MNIPDNKVTDVNEYKSIIDLFLMISFFIDIFSSSSELFTIILL